MIATKNPLLEFYDEIECIALTKYGCKINPAICEYCKRYNISISMLELEEFLEYYNNKIVKDALTNSNNVTQFTIILRDLFINTQTLFTRLSWYAYYIDFIDRHNLDIPKEKITNEIDRLIILNVLKISQ